MCPVVKPASHPPVPASSLWLGARYSRFFGLLATNARLGRMRLPGDLAAGLRYASRAHGRGRTPDAHRRRGAMVREDDMKRSLYWLAVAQLGLAVLLASTAAKAQGRAYPARTV